MDDAAYATALESAGLELADLLSEQEEIATRIAQLKQTIKSLSALTKQTSPWAEFVDELESEGITEHCRQILVASNSHLTPSEVRDRLIAAIPNYKHSPNILASIHTVLKRLVKANQAKQVLSRSGSTAYQWIRRFPRGKIPGPRDAPNRGKSKPGQSADADS